MKAQEEAGNRNFSHFGPEANLLEELQDLFVAYGKNGTGKVRKYLHDAGEAEPLEAGSRAPSRRGRRSPAGTDLMFYEGLHGAYADEKIDIAKQVDLCVGVVPIINLEWIQKLHRDQKMRGYSQEAVTDTILRRMPDYVSHLCPQFSRTHVNFQRVPIVDTSNPFIARDIPTADESMVVIRFANPKGIDFQYLHQHPARRHDDPPEHPGRARRQDGPGHADDLHADGPAPDGPEAPRLRNWTFARGTACNWRET